ncbi:Hypothetical_protein [Hexamita inflata]|uniref:Hypothetical_protein n=1 Tax=Hexamita inflata TaxID=28002 RepID=A0AA86V344_9EUKA|nr:Hypothetical protein HINF_LOCUS62011 [Hexamita inflata]
MVYNTEEYELQFQCQQQLYTFKTYEVASATNVIQSTDFASGFVFSTQVIQNAFIDIQSIGSTFTLFQTQNWFLNLKIQLDNITFGTGAMITPGQQLRINQMSIIQKAGTQISVNSGAVLSILQQTGQQTELTNLVLNISMDSSSTGALNLVGQINGLFTMKGYQIFGSYYSTNQITLGVEVVGNSNIMLEYIIITPSQFMCGNLSSYLLSSVNTSTVLIHHIVIELGNNTNKIILTSINTTEQNYQAFGGLLLYQNQCNTEIQDITLDLNNEWATQFVYYSGQMIGYTNNSNTTIKSICAKELIYTSLNTIYELFGLIGYYNGILHIQYMNINQIYQNGIHNSAGVIGISNGTSTNLININIIMNLSNKGDRVGALAGCLNADINILYNIIIKESELSAEYCGGLIAALSSSVFMSQVSVSQSIMYVNSTKNGANSYVGGIFALVNSNISIQQCNVFDLNLYANSSSDWTLAGGIVGDFYCTNATINQVAVKYCKISAYGSAAQTSSAGLSAWQFNGMINISDSCVKDTSIFSLSDNQIAKSGGLLGYVSGQPSYISNSYVSSIIIKVTGNTKQAGMIQGSCTENILTAIGVYTDGINYINDVQIINCADVISNSSENGC